MRVVFGGSVAGLRRMPWNGWLDPEEDNDCAGSGCGRGGHAHSPPYSRTRLSGTGTCQFSQTWLAWPVWLDDEHDPKLGGYAYDRLSYVNRNRWYPEYRFTAKRPVAVETKWGDGTPWEILTTSANRYGRA